jgi:hypothetical protein
MFLTHFNTRNVKIKLKSGKKLHPSMVIYIGTSKRLNDYYVHMAQYIENGKERVARYNVVRCIDPSIFNLPLT